MHERSLIRLSADDNIAVATRTIEPGENLLLDGQAITAADRIPTGHKMAVARIEPGQKVMKYGAPIGSATRPITPGQYVHIHNVRSDYLPTYERDEKLGAGG
jgi:hypothetical protein